MDHTREYKVSKVEDRYVVDILEDGYNIIEESLYFDTREEAVKAASEKMLADMMS